MTMALRRTALTRSLLRPNLILGGEREWVMFSALLAGGLIISAQNLASIIVAIPLWIVTLFFLRRMAKVDPQLTRVYFKQLHYGSYYAPRSTPFHGRK